MKKNGELYNENGANSEQLSGVTNRIYHEIIPEENISQTTRNDLILDYIYKSFKHTF
jgi:hypothetical protein